MNRRLIIPSRLQAGDKVAFVSPAGMARPHDVFAAARVLERCGLEAVVMPHALGRCGSFSGTLAERADDFLCAWTDPEIRAVICTRGGYGAVQLLEILDSVPLRDNAKWLVGFSDICVLHALMHRHGIASIHGPMARHISECDGATDNFRQLLGILTEGTLSHTFAPHPFNRTGECQAPLAGGNVSVLSALEATRFNILRPSTVLLLEDISEPVYKIERLLYQLRLSGVLGSISGLLVGQFTNTPPDINHHSMESMIRDMTSGYDYPVAFNVPVGHGGHAMPLIASAPLILSVTDTCVRIKHTLRSSCTIQM